jgi:UDP-glucose 4-epimerase
MKCLILGGAGFIGSHVAEALLAAGHAVRVFDRPDRRLAPGLPFRDAVEWAEGDFVNPSDVEPALAGCDAVFHFVSTTLPKTSNDNPAYDLETNVIRSISLLNLCLRYRVRKVVFISSGGTVYGVPEDLPIAESHPTDPICAHGIGKLAIEKYLHLYHVLHGLDYCVLRVANPYGERQRVASAQGAVTVFLERALRGASIEIWGDGSVVRDYVYVGDVARAFAAALDYGGDERVINIGSGEGRSLNDLVSVIEATLGHPVAVNHLPGRPFDVPANVLDIGRARACLKWRPETPFADGIARTATWLAERI